MAHLNNVEMKYFHTHWFDIFQFGVLGVDLFFVISGVVIAAVTYGKAAGLRNAGKFLYHRFARIYPAYWFYSLIVLAAYLYNPNLINSKAGHHVDLLPSFLLIPRQAPGLIMQAWTLSYELYFYLVFFLLLLLTPRLRPYLMLLWGVFLILFGAPLHGGVGPICTVLTSPSVFEFLAGWTLYTMYRRVELHPGFGVLLTVLAATFLTGVVLWSFRHHLGSQEWIESSPWLRPALYGTFAVLFTSGAMELERSSLVNFAGPLQSVGDWSYSIYLSHLIVIELVGRTIAHSAQHAPFAIGWVTVISLPALLLTGFLSYRYVEQPSIRFLYKR